MAGPLPPLGRAPCAHCSALGPAPSPGRASEWALTKGSPSHHLTTAPTALNLSSAPTPTLTTVCVSFSLWFELRIVFFIIEPPPPKIGKRRLQHYTPRVSGCRRPAGYTAPLYLIHHLSGLGSSDRTGGKVPEGFLSLLELRRNPLPQPLPCGVGTTRKKP